MLLKGAKNDLLVQYNEESGTLRLWRAYEDLLCSITTLSEVEMCCGRLSSTQFMPLMVASRRTSFKQELDVIRQQCRVCLDAG